jgi:hypothetical protein
MIEEEQILATGNGTVTITYVGGTGNDDAGAEPPDLEIGRNVRPGMATEANRSQ